MECVGSRWFRSGLRPERLDPVRLDPDALAAGLKNRRDLLGSTRLMLTGELTMNHSTLAPVASSSV
jgi:hypothetical protein